MKYRMVEPRTDNEVMDSGAAAPLTVSFTLRRCVFMLTSTPTTLPLSTLPFFSSTVTLSPVSRIRNLTSLMDMETQWSEERRNRGGCQ
jgi:hypothetical protein